MNDDTASDEQAASPSAPVTDSIGHRARNSPGQWVYTVDPAYDPDGAIPPHGIVGAWPVDQVGDPGAFVANPNYRPSPVALQLSPPMDELDDAMQQAATGLAAETAVSAALASRNIYIPANADGDPVAYRDDSGDYVALFSALTKVTTAAPQLLSAPIESVLDVLPVHTAVVINPGSQVSMRTTSTELLLALRDDESTTYTDNDDATQAIPHKGAHNVDS